MSSKLEESIIKPKYKIPTLLLIICFILSQFYFWKSGLPQISHIFLILSLIAYGISNKKIFLPNIQFFNIFILYVILNNITWFFINDFNNSYLISLLYWIFNYLVFILIINLKRYSKFSRLILFSIIISYAIELILWATGIGRFNYFPRYNGLFNDPNQMAFWVLSTCSIFLLLSTNKFKDLVIYCVAIFLILLTLSRSALLGIPLLTLAIILKSEGSIQRKIVVITASFFLVCLILILLSNYGYFDSIIDRFISGFDEKDTQENARGFNVLTDFPEHLLFGAGQGGYGLYTERGNEIHSTWIGLLFYYGIFGSSFFLLFIYQIFRKLTLSEKLLFLSPMLYGLTTYNARTIIFWFLLGVFYTVKGDNSR